MVVESANKLFDIPFTYGTYQACLKKVTILIGEKKSSYVCFANAHMIVEAHTHKSFKEILLSADYVFMDGMPIVFANRFINKDKDSERFAGMDFVVDIVKQSEVNGESVFFYGSTEDNLNNLANFLEIQHPNLKIAGMLSPPFRILTDAEKSEHAELINQSKTDILLVSLGCPKQEIWMHEMKNKVNCTMFGVGNAFLTLSGKEKRSPRWMQKAGLEWVFRLAMEPRRLLKRYLLTNTKFLVLLIKGFARVKN